ncbi:Clp protease ClpP [Aerococcaceae bacterium NML160702]|nr:Clp protease ClpP [Aerococcaceae bacterium NML190073]MCW6681535.1 Clp protease ClpP [Aerococcaceae bacterium NML160702]
MSEKLIELARNVIPEIKNEVSGNTKTVTLSGSVGKNSWLSEKKNINIDTVKEEIDGFDGDIVIRLNSPGGDVFSGIEIYNYLKDLKNHVTVEVTALAASAASIIAMGADEIVMCTGSNMMIHEASTFAWGNKSEIQKTLNALEAIDDSLLDIYAQRTGKSTEIIVEWLAEEKWFTADEAVSEGFADRKKETSDSNQIDVVALINQAVAQSENRITERFSAMLKPEQTANNTKQKPKGLNNIFKKEGN